MMNVGFYDMHGNVWEWCEDGRCEYTEERHVDPVGTEPALRGGGAFSEARDCRSAYRFWGLLRTISMDIIGFRPAKSVTP